MGNKAKIRRRQRCPECGSLDIIKTKVKMQELQIAVFGPDEVHLEI